MKKSIPSIVVLAGLAVVCILALQRRSHLAMPIVRPGPPEGEASARNPRPHPEGGWIVDGVRWAKKPGTMYFVGRDAKALSRQGHTEDALKLVDAVAHSGSDPADRAAAHAHRALFLHRLNQDAEAIEAAENVFSLVDENPELASNVFHWEAVNLASDLYAKGEQWENALRVNDRLLDHVGGMPAEFASTVFIHRANYLERLGRDAEAAASLDSLFSRYTNYYNAHEFSVPLRLQRANLWDRTHRTSEYVYEMMSLWNEPSVAADPRMSEVGFLLGQSLLDSGRGTEAMAHYREFAGRLESQRGTVYSSANASQNIRNPETYRRDMISILSALSSGHRFDRPDLALEAISRLRQYRTTPQEQHDLDMQEAAIHRSIEQAASRSQASPSPMVAPPASDK